MINRVFGTIFADDQEGPVATSAPFSGQWSPDATHLVRVEGEDLEVFFDEERVGLDELADAVLGASYAPKIKERLRSQTEEAKSHGIFGAPSFTLANERTFLAWIRTALALAAAEAALGFMGRAVEEK